MPMHVLISCVGSAGDVYPFFAIAKALQQRGHEVELLTSPYFRERSEAAGIPFVAIGTLADYERGVADPDIWNPVRGFSAMWRAIEPTLRQAYAEVVQRSRRDTVLVGSSLAWSSRCAQEKTGLPGATVHLAPSLNFSAIDPPLWLPGLAWLRHMPAWFTRGVQRAAERFVLDPAVAPELNAFRGELGLAAVRRIVGRWQNSPDLVVDGFPDWFASPQRDWPANSVTTDFPRWNASPGASLAAELDDFLQSGSAPIAITPGSAMAHARPMFERALAACAALGRRAVLITPFRDQLPSTLPAFAHAVSYAPFNLLLARVAAFVHHGGIGTSAQCLHAGTPQLVAPFAHDQFDNAARLCGLGVAASVAPRASVDRWVRALAELTDPRVAHACAHWSRKSRAGEPGELQIARLLESLRAP